MSDFPSKEKALGMYKKMYEIRKYEESIYYLFLEGIMPAPSTRALARRPAPSVCSTI